MLLRFERITGVARHRTLALSLAAIVCAWHITAGQRPATATALEESVALALGAPVTIALEPGGSVALSARLSPERPWRIAVEQIAIDVSVSLTDPDGNDLLTVDRPLDRDGVEYLFLRPESERPYSIEVHSLVATAPAGHIRVAVEDLSWSTAAERSRWLAEEAETVAAAAYARGGAEGRQEALVAYKRALADWQRSGDVEREALAVYSIGVLERLLGEPRAALETAERAAALFAQLNRPRWRASALNEVGQARVKLGEFAPARAYFERSVALLEGRDDPFREAISRNNICLVSLFLGRLQAGIDCYEQTLPLSRAVGDPESEARILANCGHAYDLLGQPDRSLGAYREALTIQERIGDRNGQALTLNNLAVLSRRQGELQRALELYARAADLYRAMGNGRDEALALSNAGMAYWALREIPRARSFFERSLAIQRRVEDRRGEAATLHRLALIHDIELDPDTARTLFDQALQLRREMGDRRGEGRTLFAMGRRLLAAGETRAALDRMNQSLTIAREVEDRSGEAAAMHGAGRALALSGNRSEAPRFLNGALALYRAVGSAAGQAQVLTSLGRMARANGRLDKARERLAEAVSLVESVRTRIANPELRASFLAGRGEAHELEVLTLMDLHRLAPERGYDALALAASERARARSLVDLLEEAGAGVNRRADPDLRLAYERARYRLDAAERKRARLTAGPHAAEDLSAREREIEAVLADLDRLEGQIRAASPASDLVHPPILGATEIQGLLDPNMVLLVYDLAEERSFLWWVTGKSVASHQLPAIGVIDAAARRVHAGLASLDPASAREEVDEAAALSRMILGPIADLLTDQQLVVVADGALHHIPFAALPYPRTVAGSRATRLVDRHQVVHLPSASALAAQRRLRAGRKPATRRALVIADPVFGPDDPRVDGGKTGAADSREASPPASWAELGHLERLPATRREAEAIASLAAPGEVGTVTGFAANRSLVLAGGLERYKFLHFATHGLINNRTPRLSGLVLSRLDSEGAAIDGSLNLDDVYNLELNADLVVLSGCRTASGREVRGEGLIGLTRGFMYAGAQRVVASLWRVQDRSTAELMERFYRAMWIDGLSAPAALRAAQLSLQEERRWRDPYYWAGFVLQGDWRG